MSQASSDKPKRLQAVRRSAFWWAISRFVFLVFSKVWFRIRCEGADNVPPQGPVLLVANHASYLHPGMVAITATTWVGFLAQAGLASLAPCRWWLAQVGVTLIDRDAPSKEAMRLVSDCLRAGEVVGIFPEGTRSRDGSVSSFKGGVEFLVRRTKATVVPIGIDGSHRAYPRGAWFPRPRKIIVRYGEPWTAEQVLAPGGVEALRHRVAELACCPLADLEPDAAPDAAQPGVAGGRREPPENVLAAESRSGIPPAQVSSRPQIGVAIEATRSGTTRSGTGSTADMVDPPSSPSASTGGEA